MFFFFIPFPFLNPGNRFFQFPSRSRIEGMGFFNSLPVPELREWNYPFPFPFPNSQMSFPLTPGFDWLIPGTIDGVLSGWVLIWIWLKSLFREYLGRQDCLSTKVVLAELSARSKWNRQKSCQLCSPFLLRPAAPPYKTQMSLPSSSPWSSDLFPK